MPGLILGRLIHVTLVFSRSAGAGESSEIKWREMKRSGHGASAPVHGSVTTDLGFASVDLLLGFHCPSSKVCLSFPPFFFSFHINPHTCVLSCFSCVCPDSAIPWTVAHQGCPWDSPGKNTGVGCHGILQGTCPTQGLSSHLFLLPQWQVP